MKVGVFEGSRVLEAVTEEAVEGYVGDPDEGDCCGLMPVFNVTG